MDAKELLIGRRSHRRFTEQQVSAEELAVVVEEARFAPSWKNTQTVRYTAILDGEVKNRIADEAVMGFAFNQKTIHSAPALIVVTTIDGRSGYERDGSASTSKGSHWQSFDAGAAAQTFCLAAHLHGLGTVIMGIYDEAVLKTLLPIPEDESVSALIAIGYAADTPDAPRRKDVAELLRIIE